MTGEGQGQQKPPEDPPRKPRVIPGVGGKLDPPSVEGKELKLEFSTSGELAKLSSTSELAPLKEKQGAKKQKKKGP
ncbi:MAG: hypothetical protein WBZ42_03615 [Halobacteriota archaeon]